MEHERLYGHIFEHLNRRPSLAAPVGEIVGQVAVKLNGDEKDVHRALTLLVKWGALKVHEQPLRDKGAGSEAIRKIRLTPSLGKETVVRLPRDGK